MEEKKFKMIDEEFICENCNTIVKPLGYTARNHCPKCLYSKHVDILPGDRKETCHGLLKPIGISINPMIASLTMVVSSITVILNALRLKR